MVIVAHIDPPDPKQDRNPVRFVRRYLRDAFGEFPMSADEEAFLYELEEFCDDLVDPVTGLACRPGARQGHPRERRAD